jgi:hypothetical protein
MSIHIALAFTLLVLGAQPSVFDSVGVGRHDGNWRSDGGGAAQELSGRVIAAQRQDVTSVE